MTYDVIGHWGLVVRIAAAWGHKTGMEIDDLIQVAALGLLEANRRGTFDAPRGDVTPLAAVVMRDAILTYVAKMERQGRRIPPISAVTESVDRWRPIGAVQPSDIDLMIDLRDCIEALLPEERLIARRLWLRDEKARDVASSLGVQESRVSKIKSRTRTKLRSFMRDGVPKPGTELLRVGETVVEAAERHGVSLRTMFRRLKAAT